MKAILQPSLRGLSGKMGDWVYRYSKDKQKTVIAERPVFTKDTTEAQLNVRERFGDASRYSVEAIADPVRCAFYTALAEARGITPQNAAFSDFCNVPSFKPLDLANYQGRVGDPIYIRVENENGLVSMDVSLDNVDGSDIEKGRAVEVGNRSGKWIYLATQPVALGSDIFIEVVAVDYTGKKITLTENPIVGAEE